jgi:uncharacterized membrane protein YraQ (UPF0718 family)
LKSAPLGERFFVRLNFKGEHGHVEIYRYQKDINMFGSGQIIALLVMGLILGVIVQSYATKKGMASLGNLGLGACVLSSFIGAPFGLRWLLALPTMGVFLAIISSRK